MQVERRRMPKHKPKDGNAHINFTNRCYNNNIQIFRFSPTNNNQRLSRALATAVAHWCVANGKWQVASGKWQVATAAKYLLHCCHKGTSAPFDVCCDSYMQKHRDIYSYAEVLTAGTLKLQRVANEDRTDRNSREFSTAQKLISAYLHLLSSRKPHVALHIHTNKEFRK